MTVYVDSSMLRFGRMKMCHMIADTLEELHAMADRIGVARRHFQGNASFPHYDICKAKRQIALEMGAREATRRELVEVMHKYRQNNPQEGPCTTAAK